MMKGADMKKNADVANKYDGLLEEWKLRLILDRARRKGIRPEDIADAQQEIVPQILAFRYDDAKSNGASESTALTSLIDRRLAFFQRRQARLRRKQRRYRYSDSDEGELLDDVPVPSETETVSLAIDVREAVAGLTPHEQLICCALAQRQSCAKIAARLGISRYKVRRHVEAIRERFTDRGVDGWVMEQ